ncbi:MAG: trifunctional transcriptional regulator/proline dehydrogenase/L-glutamate gamma-semialdehyde dehydrogenase [Candidatus Dasytiphilus stammeri]
MESFSHILDLIGKDETLEEKYFPFSNFSSKLMPYANSRKVITDAWRIPETQAIPILLEQARLDSELKNKIKQLAYILVENVREQHNKSGQRNSIQQLLQEYSLSSEEGVALMCLAEALLRIPDSYTRTALIRDKITKGKWKLHLGASTSFFVNAATWGLLLTGKLLEKDSISNNKLFSLLHSILRKCSEPLIRKIIDFSIRLIGKQFVIGETISKALSYSIDLESKGFRYSYDMLGEAALTSKDAQSYFVAYQEAIEKIGMFSNKRGIYEGPGISIKLSALHPRYNYRQRERVMQELYPLLKSLMLLAKQYDIGINIDAEEADRLELSVDLLEKLCFEPELAEWNGIGFVIQSYQKRCPFLIDHLIDLAHRSNHRLMIRLVKGAYWDSEIKWSQIEGYEDYPVYTRKAYTDISYIGCARKLLSVPKFIYPQFATHNAQTMATIYHLAGSNYYPGQYEFQGLHGMCEKLYDQVVGNISQGGLNRPCRIYAPVGSYEKLLAYLVRRLLENGANTSFVNKLANRSISINHLIEDPVDIVEKISRREGIVGASHPNIPLPRYLYGKSRLNSRGLDLNNHHQLAKLGKHLFSLGRISWYAEPLLHVSSYLTNNKKEDRIIINPANITDIVGYVREANEHEVNLALTEADKSWHKWWSTNSGEKRASILEEAANIMEKQMLLLISILIRESGKTFSNAIAEVREGVDFLRYYSSQIRNKFDNLYIPLGIVVCISPWNFPLAIFTGQIAAALAVGNSVLAKPAEQTPLIAAQVVKIMYQAGVPQNVLQLIIGRGSKVGSHLIRDSRVRGIMFTGSTVVATSIQKIIAGRVDTYNRPIPLIAETGGINAMIVDSSALTEQVVLDIIHSAFDSAGQRCSALRLLCIQEDVAEYTINMLQGAMREYLIGSPDQLETDIGPVITRTSKKNIESYIHTMRARKYKIFQSSLGSSAACNTNIGHFIPPTLIEINSINELKSEIFGPVLHIVRFNRYSLPTIISSINDTGYGLTLGLHTRIDDTITKVNAHANIGNLYINRNIVGAVVGVQPFGGEGLSGTGPKAGGPLYLYRLLSTYPEDAVSLQIADYEKQHSSLIKRTKSHLFYSQQIFKSWVTTHVSYLAKICQKFEKLSECGTTLLLQGPTGEDNTYSLLPRKGILCLAFNQQDIFIQLAAVMSTGGRVVWLQDEIHQKIYQALPQEVKNIINFTPNIFSDIILFDTVLYHGDLKQMCEVCVKIARINQQIIPVYGYASGDSRIFLERLLLERSVSINTSAAGGNAHLITINEPLDTFIQ